MQEEYEDDPPKSLKCLKILGFILFFIGIFELYAVTQYKNAFEDASTAACCGLIAQDASDPDYDVLYDDVFACKESLILDGVIPVTSVSGGIMCEINNEICDSYRASGITITLSECLSDGGYSLEDMCGTDALDLEIESTMDNVGSLITIATIMLVVTSIYCLLETFKCEKALAYWSSKFSKSICFCVQLITFIILLYYYGDLVEDPVKYGYDVVYASGTDAGDYAKDNCMDVAMVWMDYDIDVNGFTKSNFMVVIAGVGGLLTLIELCLVAKNWKYI